MTTVQQLLNSKPHQDIYSVSPDRSTYEALQLMAEKNVGAVAVMEQKRLIGILTERDYARKIVLHGKASRHTPVGETMNKNYPTVALTDSIDDCMQLMTDQRFRYVAVMDGDKLLGLISIGDVVKSVIEQQQANIEHLQRYITGT